MESHRFEADVRQILELVTHSLYSDREIFLRELISNASDALDRARFESVKRDDLRAAEGEPAIHITVDKGASTITITDDGIGLSHDEALKNLGTIAHSGTRAFAEALKSRGQAGEGLIGKFGVGFYSSFMVADRVVVESLSALPGEGAIRWTSEGGESFTLEPGDREQRGTKITLHVRLGSDEFLEVDKLREIVRKHSDFVSWPIYVDGVRGNQEQALWTRSPAEVTDEEYTAFYKHTSGDWDEPLIRLHVVADAPLQFQAVLFIPKRRPWEMDRLDFKPGLKLYQKRVKILENAESLLPRFLRFVRGVVDAPEVELNVSRELLQQTPVLRAIRAQLTKRLLKKFKEIANKDRATYEAFWEEFGHIIKEGIAEENDSREAIIPLLRFKSTRSLAAPAPKSEDEAPAAELVDQDGNPAETASDEAPEVATPSVWRSLADAKKGMAEGQEHIWYLADADKERVAVSPILEGFKKRDWEVLLLDDPVDEWVTMHVREFDGTSLKSASHGDLPVDDKADDPVAKKAREQAEPLASWLHGLLRDKVADVRLSTRLIDSPAVLVDQEGAMSANLERILKAANQKVAATQRVLEINPEHAMVKNLARLQGEGKEGMEPFALLLLDYANIAEGRLEDSEGFTRRLQALLERASANL